MPATVHDDESSMPIRDHDDCVSFQEFRGLRKTVDSMAEDLRAVKEALMLSTPTRPCVIDTQRKHGAEIADLQESRAASFPRRIWETAIITAVQVITALALAMFAKGFVVSLMAEALKSAGGAK